MIGLFADSYVEMQTMSTTAIKIGLMISLNKISIFSLYIPERNKISIFINSSPLEELPGFKYLGSTLTPNGQAKDEILDSN